MKKQINATYYKCKGCNMIYRDKKLAEKCKSWCKKRKSCNLELIKYAIK